ncbi:DUF2059 domain-containing protein [uncultured Sphingomonas sp.]|uniref:DUF2059 domain-containing protein n=1 Tax=uncultured Sphingomonas sp. TaxID=158754 RepID=UPI0035CBFC5E
MRIRIGAALVLVAASYGGAQAQVSASAVAGAVDPARLAAARELIDVLIPPATREQMIVGMMKPMLANIRQGFTNNPQFAATLGTDPRVKTLFDQFMAQQETRTTELMHRALPGMFPAMANAYARRFDLQQLRDIRAFFETPSGRAYMQASFTIMSDPDIAAWQRQMMTQSMGHVQEDVAGFVQQVTALESKKP